jgi:outer membrane lipoprotein-sorting protein
LRITRKEAVATLLIALAIFLAACASAPPAQSPTQTPQATATVEPPTLTPEPPTATPVPPTATTVPSPTPVPPTATPVPPTPTTPPTATRTPVVTPTPARLSNAIVSLLARSKGITEYSFDLKLSVSAGGKTAEVIAGTYYVKGTRYRLEMEMEGIEVHSVGDYSTRTIYTWLPGQKTARKAQMTEPTPGQAQTPSDVVSTLSPDAKIIRTERIDGKAATVIETSTKSSTASILIWIWDEKGMPLKLETQTSGATVTATYSSYKFAKQADSLFVLPKGMTIREQ